MGPTVHKSLQEAIQRTGYISDRSTCAENTSATGSGIKSAHLGKKAQFTITSRDSQSRQRKRGGDVYAVKLNKEEYEVKVDVIDKDDGTYLAEYTVPEQNYLSLIFSFLVGGGGARSVHIVRVLARCSHQRQPFCCTSYTVFSLEWEKKLIFRGHSFKAAEKNTNKRNGIVSYTLTLLFFLPHSTV